ncbi:MAG: FkbM family methyltransferase [Candidatus Saccharimonadales bacterium]
MSQLPDERIYYAQNREDLILESFFPDTKKGFYVDVGACHPHVASVTKRFYLKGWKGINIEPQTELCALFDIERKRDTNISVAISDKEATATMRAYVNNRGLTTFSPDMKNDYEHSKGNKTEEFEDIPIITSTLGNLLARQEVESIQFLKVDVEGFEYEVLNGNDWSRFRPEVICIEANHVIKDWRSLLVKNKYEKVFFDGLNEYYVDRMTDRASKFNYVDHVVTNLKGGIASDDFDLIEKANRESREQAQLVSQLERELQSVKGMLKRTVLLLPSKIKTRLTKNK